jgi:hypothetical protein
MKKKATTTKLFVVVVASCTQDRRKGNKIVGDETPRNKHKPKPKLKPQECTTMVKKVYSLEEEHNDEEKCDDDYCCFHLLHTRKERGE